MSDSDVEQLMDKLMPKHVGDEAAAKLWIVANDYLDAAAEALESWDWSRSMHYPQHIVGLLGTCCELLMKSHLVRQSPLLVLHNLPPVTAVEVLRDSRKDRAAGSQRLFTLLAQEKIKSITLEEAFDLFFAYFPGQRPFLSSHARAAQASRNASLHWLLPPFRKYEVDRLVFLVSKIHDQVLEANSDHLTFQVNRRSELLKQLVPRFNADAATRVGEKMRDAQAKTHSLQGVTWGVVSAQAGIRYPCPVCGGSAVLAGTPGVDPLSDGEEILQADSLQCSHCGLQLDGIEELRLASVDTTPRLHGNYWDRDD